MSELVESLFSEDAPWRSSGKPVMLGSDVMADLSARIETLTREKSALEADNATFRNDTEATENRIIDAEFAAQEAKCRAEAAEKTLDDLHEKLQAIGEEFGVDGGEERIAGIRRVLTEQKAHIADAAEVIRPFAEVAEHDIGDIKTDADRFRPMASGYNHAPLLTVGNLRAARAWSDKHDKGEK